VHVHRLVVVDDDNVVQGIVSLSDILHYLVLAPLGASTSCHHNKMKSNIKEQHKTKFNVE